MRNLSTISADKGEKILRLKAVPAKHRILGMKQLPRKDRLFGAVFVSVLIFPCAVVRSGKL